MTIRNVPALLEPGPESELGPAMAALTEKQRNFVIALLETGGQDATMAARMAGYSNTGQSAKVRAYELSHSPKIAAALREEADRRLKAGAILGASALVEIAKDRLHKDRFKAAESLLNRAGLQVITQHKVTVEDNRSDDEIIARAIALAKKLGVEPKAFLANYGVVLDAEFTEIPAREELKVLQVETPESFPEREVQPEKVYIPSQEAIEDQSTEGLEDLL